MPFPVLPQSAGQTLSVTITDSVGIADSLAKTITSNLTDTIGLSDTISKTALASLTDTLGLSDTISKTASPVLTDSLGITDTGTVVAKAVSGIDTIGLSDFIVLGVTTVITDSVGITDTIQTQASLNPTQTDSVNLTDTLALSISKVQTDNLGITDTITPVLISGGTTLTVTITDSIGITDSPVVKTKTATGIDTIGITDDIVIFRDIALTDIVIVDSVNISDTRTASVTYSRTITDSISITDNDLDEIVSLTDNTVLSGAGTLTLSGRPGLYRPTSLSSWSTKWDAVPISGPGTGTGGWLGGDGCWSINHPSNTSAIFTFGDTPVSTVFSIALTGTSATSQGTATDRLIILDGQAGPFPAGGKVQVFLSDGTTLRYPGVFKISTTNSGFGYTNLNLTTALPSAPAIGDIVKGATGGTDYYFPNSSCVLWTTPNDLQLVSGTDPWIPNDGDGSWYWAGPMVVDSDGKLYVFPSKQQHDASPAGYSVIARGLFQFTWTDAYTVPTSAVKITDMTGAIGWGAAATNDSSYNYIFGTHKPNSGDYSFNLYVARIARGLLASDPATTWQFWTSTGWQTGSTYFTDPTNLVKLITNGSDSFQGVENTVSAQVLAGSFKLTSKRGGVFGSDITVWESTSITGPYLSRVVGNAPYQSPTTNDQTYLSNGHFELPSILDGNYLVSISKNRAGLTTSDYYAGSQYYRPTWFETASTGAATGTLALTGVGTLSTTGKPVFVGTVTLSGSGTLAGNGTGTIGATCSLLGNGSLTLVGKPILVGSETLSGSGTLITAGTLTVVGSVALSGSGSLSGVGTTVASVALSGSGSLITQAQGAGTAVLSGNGTLSLSASGAVSGSVALSGAGSLTGTGLPNERGTQALSGSGTLILAGSAAVVGTAALSGSGSLTGTQVGQSAIATVNLSGTGSNVPIVQSISTMGTETASGTGTLGISAGANFPGSITTSGSGSLGISGVFSIVSVVTTNGSGTLALSGAKASITSATAALSGTGSLASAGAQLGIVGASASLFGSGSLAIAGVPGYKSSVLLNGTGSLSLLSNTARTGYATVGTVTGATATSGIPKTTITAISGIPKTTVTAVSGV